MRRHQPVAGGQVRAVDLALLYVETQQTGRVQHLSNFQIVYLLVLSERPS